MSIRYNVLFLIDNIVSVPSQAPSKSRVVLIEYVQTDKADTWLRPYDQNNLYKQYHVYNVGTSMQYSQPRPNRYNIPFCNHKTNILIGLNLF